MQQKTRAFLEEFRVSPQDFVGDYIPISPGISHPAGAISQPNAEGLLDAALPVEDKAGHAVCRDNQLGTLLLKMVDQ